MRSGFFFLLLMVSLHGAAQEVWMQPSKFRIRTNETITVSFLEGANFDGEPWDLSSHKTDKLDWYKGTGVSDIRKEIKATEKSVLVLKGSQDGTQLLAMQSNYTKDVSTAAEFNGFLKDQGLDDILKQRIASGMSASPVRERCVRFSKMLFQVGAVTDDIFRKKTGLPLEIIPLQNPYSMHTGDYLDCLILYEGKPLPHQLVRVFNSIGNASFLQDIYTENDGTIRFPISAQGRWMISTVHIMASGTAEADWQSMRSSLVFGI